MSRPRFRASHLLAAAGLFAASTVVAGCGGDGPIMCNADLTGDAGRKVQAFLDTSNSLINAAKEIDDDMLGVCRKMAADLGVPASQLVPPPSMQMTAGAQTDVACKRVVREIDSILQDALPAQASLAVVYTPSVCTVDAQAETRCIRECRPTTITVTDLVCEPGKLYGTCGATCTGQCGGSCDVTCTGRCVGSCEGTCSGHCNGTCDGTCTAKNADGTCYGRCDGTCRGTCDATCSGKCSGSCNGSCTGSCSGSCTGDCNLWVDPPKCTEIKRDVVVDDCETTCHSKAQFEAQCTDPTVDVTYTFDAPPGTKARLDALLQTLVANLPTILKITERTTGAIGDAAIGYSAALAGATQTAKQLGVDAAACVAAAVDSTATAVSRIQVSASVSVSITASASVEGGLGAPMSLIGLRSQLRSQ